MTGPPDVTSPRARSQSLANAAAVGVVMLLVLVLAARFSTFNRSPGWVGPVVAVMYAATMLLTLVLTRGIHSVVAWIAVVGGAMALFGSGLTRGRLELPSRGRVSGEIIGRLQTSWPLLLAGVVVAFGAIVFAHLRRRNAGDAGWASALALLSLAAGTVVVVLLMRDMVVGHWIEGRPVRRRGRLVLPPRRASSGAPEQDSWLAAADHEAAAVTAFTDLAIRRP